MADVKDRLLRDNTVAGGGRGEYLIRGHEWLFSVKMDDAHLIGARRPEGCHSCFFAPRWKLDGIKNRCASSASRKRSATVAALADLHPAELLRGLGYARKRKVFGKLLV